MANSRATAAAVAAALKQQVDDEEEEEEADLSSSMTSAPAASCDIVEATREESLDVEDLLGIAPACQEGGSSSSRRLPAGIVEYGIDEDMELSSLPLPPEVTVRMVGFGCTFSVGCKVDLKRVAFKVRNSEFNPRRTP
ncbi:unnamed protein product, partial [Polarella glacialis]